MPRPGLPKTTWSKPAVSTKPTEEAPASQETLTQIRAKNPPVFKRSPQQDTWAQRFDTEEARVEQQEAELALRQRQDEIKAVEEELMTRAVNRRLALGFGTVGVRLLGTMDLAAKKLDSRVKEDLEGMSNKELRETIMVLGTAVQRAQGAIESSAKAERYMARHEIRRTVDDDDLEDLDSEGAMTILKNLQSSLNSITGKGKVVTGSIVDVKESDPIHRKTAE